jgi:flagellar protein FlaG
MSTITVNSTNLGEKSKLLDREVPTLESRNLVNSTDADLVRKIANTVIKDPNVVKENQPSREVIAKAAEQIQGFVKEMGRSLSFSIDETTGYNVVKVVNPETQEVIRQLPSEELLKIARNMEIWNSVLVNQKA